MRYAALCCFLFSVTACGTPHIDELDGGCACFDPIQELNAYPEEDWLHAGYDTQLAAAHKALWKNKVVHWSTANNGLRLGVALSHTEMREDEKLRIRIIVENCSTKSIEFERPVWDDMINPLGSHSFNSGQIYARSSGQVGFYETICDCQSLEAMFIPAGESQEFYVKTCVHNSPTLEIISEMRSLSNDIYYEELYWAGNPGEANEEICVQLHYNENNTHGEDAWRGNLSSPVIPLTIHR